MLFAIQQHIIFRVDDYACLPQLTPFGKHTKLAYRSFFYRENLSLAGNISLYMQKTYTPVWAIEVVYPDNQSDWMTVSFVSRIQIVLIYYDSKFVEVQFKIIQSIAIMV